VFSKDLLLPLAQVLKNLGSEHVLLVHSEDGLDEISIASATHVAELKEGELTSYQIKPEDFSVDSSSLDSLSVASAEESLAMINDVLSGKEGPASDIVVLNAGAAIYAANVTGTLEQGVQMAKDLVASGQAKEKLKELLEFSEAC
jgi:anthranilate phosphoribosyltransferase